VSLDRQAVERRLQERNREDAKEAKSRILRSFPLGLLSFLTLTLILSSVLWILRLGPGCITSFLIAGGVSLVAILLDTLFHPSEHWHQTKFYLAAVQNDAAPPPTEAGAGSDDTPAKEIPDFLENVQYVAGRVLRIVLGGPRNLREGLELLQLVRARSHEDVLGAGTLFLQWLRQKGRTLEADLESTLGANPRLRLGYTLDTDLGLLEWTTIEGKRGVDVRPIQGVT